MDAIECITCLICLPDMSASHVVQVETNLLVDAIECKGAEGLDGLFLHAGIVHMVFDGVHDDVDAHPLILCVVQHRGPVPCAKVCPHGSLQETAALSLQRFLRCVSQQRLNACLHACAVHYCLEPFRAYARPRTLCPSVSVWRSLAGRAVVRDSQREKQVVTFSIAARDRAHAINGSLASARAQYENILARTTLGDSTESEDAFPSNIKIFRVRLHSPNGLFCHACKQLALAPWPSCVSAHADPVSSIHFKVGSAVVPDGAPVSEFSVAHLEYIMDCRYGVSVNSEVKGSRDHEVLIHEGAP